MTRLTDEQHLIELCHELIGRALRNESDEIPDEVRASDDRAKEAALRRLLAGASTPPGGLSEPCIDLDLADVQAKMAEADELLVRIINRESERRAGTAGNHRAPAPVAAPVAPPECESDRHKLEAVCEVFGLVPKAPLADLVSAAKYIDDDYRRLCRERNEDAAPVAPLTVEAGGHYCAQCYFNGYGKLSIVDGTCPNPRCVLKTIDIVAAVPSEGAP